MPSLLNLPDLTAALDRLLGQIPRGRVTTYGDIAEALGDIKAARWVAEALSTPAGHSHHAACACHRVIRRTGEVGGYAGSEPAEKIAKLEAEGIAVEGGKVELSSRWCAFDGEAPLRQLAAQQDELAALARSVPIEDCLRLVAGVDAAFVGEQIVATCVVQSFPELETVAEWTHVTQVRFPYLPGYLAFRELPALLELWQQLDAAHRPDLVLVDGNGRLHPRRAGIAVCFGVLTGVATIGIGKSLLCGRVDTSRTITTPAMGDITRQPVVDGDEWLGDCMIRQPRSKPIYASIGHLVDRASLRWLLPQLFRGHRLPEPIYQADRLSKVMARQSRR